MKKMLITIGIFLGFVLLIVAVGFAIEPSSGIHAIDNASPCPVTGCASTECHAWDSLLDRYKQASDASLNLWIVMPVALVVALLVLVRVLSRPKGAN